MNKKAIAISAAVLAAFTATAALPTLTGLSDMLENLTSRMEARFSETAERLAETTNRLAQAEAQNATLVTRIEAMVEFRDSVLFLIEHDKKLREAFHGGRLGQYVVTNDSGRIIRVDLYGDATAWTNGTTTAVRITDPEARAKELARLAEEQERIRAAWEAANLPPDLAALRAAQRERERQNAAAEAK